MMNKAGLRDICILIIVGFLMIIVVNPIGNFPINDDWQYARPVFNLVKHGYYYSSDTYSPVLVAQVIWGALFCLPFGFSYTTLRISVLVLSLVGVIVLYLLVKGFTGKSKLSLVCALLLLVNPLYFSLSNSFMTDVPFITFALLSIFFFSKALNTEGRKYLMPAIIFSVIATLVRQFGIVIPIAFGITQVIKNRPSLKGMVRYFKPAIVAIAALILTLQLLRLIGSGLNPYQGTPISEFFTKPDVIAFQILERSSFLLYYCGIFLFPILIFLGFKSFKQLSSKEKIGVGLLLILCTPFLMQAWGRFPTGNILNCGYVGPKTLRDVAFLHSNDLDNISSLTRNIFSAIGLIGGILLLVNVSSMIIRIIQPGNSNSPVTSRSQRVYILLVTAGYAFLMYVPDFFFDRYVLPLIALVLLIIVSQVAKEWPLKSLVFYFSIGYIVVLGVFSSLATHDYLQWNRSRWEALNYLKNEQKISPYLIDGGYEFNGWQIGKYFPERKDKSWWFVYDDEYMVTFGEIPGYEVVEKYPYTNYFPHEQRDIYIMHRK